MIETNDNIKNTQLEHNRKYGDNYCTKIEVRCNNKFFDRTKNKTKNLMIKHYHVQYGMNKPIFASHGRYQFFKPHNLIILLEGKLYKKNVNTY